MTKEEKKGFFSSEPVTTIIIIFLVIAYFKYPKKGDEIIDKIGDETTAFFTGKAAIPKDWVRQKSPVSRTTIACPESWPKGTNGLMGAIWVTDPYPDKFSYVALRKFKAPKPSFDFKQATKQEFMASAIPQWSLLTGLNINQLRHGFEMDGEEAIWGIYSGYTVKRTKFYGFSAITWKDGYLYVLQSENQKPLKKYQYSNLIKVANLVDLK